MLQRILEPELMDTAEDAHEYDAMDHTAVNAVFVTDLIAALQTHQHDPARSLQRSGDSDPQPFTILDLGAGTAQIPIEFARRVPHVHIIAVDAAENMLALARENIAAAGLTDRITPVLADAKRLERVGWAPPTNGSDQDMVGNAHPTGFADATFDAVISNSIIHHIPEPRIVVAEAVRVTRPGGLLFHRDLARPNSEAELQHLVDTYAAGCTPNQRRLYAESLHAALTAEEMAQLVSSFGFSADTVRMTSDRHWTWCASKS